MSVPWCVLLRGVEQGRSRVFRALHQHEVIPVVEPPQRRRLQSRRLGDAVGRRSQLDEPIFGLFRGINRFVVHIPTAEPNRRRQLAVRTRTERELQHAIESLAHRFGTGPVDDDDARTGAGPVVAHRDHESLLHEVLVRAR